MPSLFCVPSKSGGLERVMPSEESASEGTSSGRRIFKEAKEPRSVAKVCDGREGARVRAAAAGYQCGCRSRRARRRDDESNLADCADTARRDDSACGFL